MNKFIKFITSRSFFTFGLLLFQLAVLGFFSIQFAWTFEYYFISLIVAIIFAISIYFSKSNPSYKIAWILLIMCLPLFGLLLYVLFANKKLGKWGQRKIKSYEEITSNSKFSKAPKSHSPSVLEDPSLKRQAEYVSRIGDYKVMANTQTTYFPLGDLAFETILEKLKLAKNFIFLEFFIYEAGEMFDSTLEVLKQKVKEGVEVYLMYDDMGSIDKLPLNFDKKLRSLGIHATKFNPIRVRLNSRLNYRDHRKIIVIDGNIAFNGGINFADEYINRKIRFGHWKDTMIMLEGQGVWNLSLMFLQIWSFSNPHDHLADDVSRFFPTLALPSDGLVQPFGDSPLDNHNVSEDAYLQIINTANKYVWITTPYLILDNEMITSLVMAAQSGIDVRIITPSVPDKKSVFEVTRSNYERLIKGGVKILEYSPGFIHSKVFLSDDKLAIVGTANLDYRSLYLHFECGTLLYNCSCLKDIKSDFEKTFEKSHEVTIQEIEDLNFFHMVFRKICNLAAPLL